MVGRLERNKDLAQELVENTAHRVGNITSIITGAVAGIVREIGELVTDGFEMREAAKAASADQSAPRKPVQELDEVNGYDADDEDD